MKKFLAILTAFFFAASAHAGDIYKLDPNHSVVVWSANHFGYSSPSGKFTDVDGTITLDEENAQLSSVDVTIKTASLTTGLPKFEEHLKSKDFLEVDTFPTAKFVSSSVALTSKTTAKVRGKLTLHGITQPVTLDVKLNKLAVHPITQKKTAGFSATATIKRSTFGMQFGLPGVSDNVKIMIEAEAGLVSEGAATANSSAAEWKIQPQKSKLEFKASHENSSVSGSFKNFTGKINFDPKQLQTSKVMIEVDTTSVDVSFDEALDTVKDAGWLAVKTFPKAIFTAEKFTPLSGKNSYRATGTLTAKGKSVPIALDFTLDQYTDTHAKATGFTTVKRSSFNIGDRDLKKSNGIRDEVVVNFVIEADR